MKTLFIGAFLMGIIGLGAGRAPAQEPEQASALQLKCALAQQEYLAGALIPLPIELVYADYRGRTPKILTYANTLLRGPNGGLFVRCTAPDGAELPQTIALPPGETMRIVQQGTSWKDRIDLLRWFNPPIGGPYSVEVSYAWTGVVPGFAPHWTGHSTVATAQFSVRGLRYGDLTADERAVVDRALDELKHANTAQNGREALIALGARALPALHDALLIAHLDHRAHLLDILGSIRDPSSLPHISNCPLHLGGLTSIALAKARQNALQQYDAGAIIPFLVDELRQGRGDGMVAFDGVFRHLGAVALEPVLQILREEHPVNEKKVVSVTVRALLAIGDLRAVPALEAFSAEKPEFAKMLQPSIDQLKKKTEAPAATGVATP